MTSTIDKGHLITVAMVAYNSSAYIREAIESVLCSSYERFELLIADDNSTDDTWQIIQSYTDPRIRAIRNEKNLGEYPNRDQCVRLAAGEYLIFIDGDDIIYPHGLEFSVRMLDAFPECGMALMRWFRNNLIYPAIISPGQFYIGEYFGQGFLGTAFSNVVFRTEILRNAGSLTMGYKCGDDYIRYKIALHHPALLISDSLTWWRETPGQAFQTHHRSGRLFLDSYRLRFEFLDHPDCPLSREEIAEARENLYKALSTEILKALFKFKVEKVRGIVSELKFQPRHWLKCFNRFISKDPLEGSTPVNPYRCPIGRNPYSKCPQS
ncbi:MAG: glycosyltransferase family 2 protein [Bacteroidota bacterium]|nr:glycosyltransferase family 2 protein [Bacteroidota bacterium]MDP4247673.1 glycosyltransferase family 2 protein [Bacteroidota bacterium]MDP4254769.1 glycosyltransferase family 2 protein [Bacteroidota bacterium]MDP4260373.1 glycosyltransferase family 2 protein [Bacteroidota bacterium]